LPRRLPPRNEAGRHDTGQDDTGRDGAGRFGCGGASRQSGRAGINRLLTSGCYGDAMDNAPVESEDAGDDGFRVVVPTRDSAPWIAALAGAYRHVGVRPLFLVDSRSTDGTLGELRRLGADAVEVLPAEDCVEDIVWRIPAFTSSAWVLRLDDDEMPSVGMLQWIRANLRACTAKVAFPRRWAFMTQDGTLSYAEHRQLYYMEVRPDLLDPQIRLYRPDKVTYTRNIHTPGFTMEGDLHIAPPEAFICHFDWIARSFEERHAKLRRYDIALPGCGFALLYFYLPELLHPVDRCETPFETTEFDVLASVFAQHRRRRNIGTGAEA
jgi:hypothetical protein